MVPKAAVLYVKRAELPEEKAYGVPGLLCFCSQNRS